jgi:ABC-2 type transport system ATP-binding protein
MEMSIEIKNITKRFGNVCALDNISLTLTEGRIYGLLGNNGAGKTTLLNIMTDRLQADGGEVLVDGETAADHDSALGKIFMAGEQNLYPEDMRVREAFRTTALFHPAFDPDYANELAQQFELNTRKKITALSTGYTSIFRLITALSVNTPYLLLDEPVLGLDANHRDLFYRLLIEKYSEHPCTIVISTHLIAEVKNLIEDVIIIRNGRILRQVPREELLGDGYAVSGPAGLVDSYLQGRETLSQKSLGGLKTACVRGTADRSQLPAGVEVSAVSLQDYFISLMNEEEHK